MPINVSMMKRRLLRALSGQADLRAAARRRWTLCPEQTTTVPPALFPAGEVERIQALSPWRNWPTERLLIEGGPMRHAPSVAHEVHDVTLVGPCLYAGPAKDQPGFGIESWLVNKLPPRQPMRHASLVTTRAGSHFFGTFLRGDIPLNLMPDDPDTAISMLSKRYDHEEGYRQLLDVPRARVVRHAHIRRLMLYTDHGQNDSKEFRYLRLRRSMRQNLARGGVLPDGRGVYIRRGRTGELRLLENDEEIERTLVAAGFRVVDPGADSAHEIAAAALGAKIVVSVEGSHLAHGIYAAADEATFLVLQPPDRFSMAYKEFTDRVGMRYAFLVGDKTPGGFTIDPQALLRMLDRLA